MGFQGLCVCCQQRTLAVERVPVLLLSRGRPQVLGLKVGRQRHLGVDHKLLLARELDHEVGPDGVPRSGAVVLLMEIHVAEHAGGFHHTPQLDLAPLAAGAVGPQGGLQGMG